jgi:hypothetical protein
VRVAGLSDKGLLIEVDLQELRILSTALNTVCNRERLLDNLEERLSGTKDKAESLLISIRGLNLIFDRLIVPEALVDDIESLPAAHTVKSLYP